MRALLTHRRMLWFQTAMLMMLGAGQAVACNWSWWFPDPPIEVYILGPAAVCPGSVVQYYCADALDLDYYEVYDKHDNLLDTGYAEDVIDSHGYTWEATCGTLSGDLTSGCVTWQAPSTPTTCTIKCKANDIPYEPWDPPNTDRVWPPDKGSRNDPESAWATLEVSPIRVQVSVTRPVLEIGQCREYPTFATATVTPWPILGCGVSWSVDPPLRIKSQSPNGLMVQVTSDEPAECEVTGLRIIATVCGCQGQAAVSVKRFGPFSVTGPTSNGITYYNGEVTFMQLGEEPPQGCGLLDPVYGVIETLAYQFSSACPLPSDTPCGETIETAPGCQAVDCQRGGGTLQAGQTTATILDDIGFLACSCTDPHFGIALQKSLQTFWIGDPDKEECILSRQCIEVRRWSPLGSCVDFTQSVFVASGWDDCNCF